LTVAPAKLQGLPAWRLGVHDNGRGMSADQQARLFEPFNRLGMEREGIPGTGIGLSIVRQLVQEMGGTLGLHSEAGQGSAFEICLPAATSGPVAAEAVAPLVQGLGLNALAAKDPIKVLYVEDNPVNDLLVRQILGTCSDYEVISAPDGQSGITAALSHLPRIVLLDLQLPDMSGLEVFKQLQEHAQMAGVRFVALSANAMPSDIREALSLGFDAYWTKPLDVARFLADMDAMAASLRLA
jgi:CheY-like chemotaxis protein